MNDIVFFDYKTCQYINIVFEELIEKYKITNKIYIVYFSDLILIDKIGIIYRRMNIENFELLLNYVRMINE